MLVAIDTNVPLDLAQGVADVVDALTVIRGRIAGARLIATRRSPAMRPRGNQTCASDDCHATVALELAYLSNFAEEEDVRSAAQTALRSLASKWGIQPVNLVPVGHGIVDAIAAKIRARGLLPDEETHDALILAETALLGCSILLTSDGHLRAVNHGSLSLLLKASHVAAPIIATPREIVRKFFR